MSNRLSDEKAQLIASTYCTNGLQKVNALLTVGYKQSYAEKVGLKLYDNVLVKRAISKIQALQVTKTGMTVDKVQEMYVEDRDFARKCRQSGAAVSATTGIARLYGMDKDANIGEKTVIIISPKVVSPKPVESEVIDEQEAGDALQGQG